LTEHRLLKDLSGALWRKKRFHLTESSLKIAVRRDRFLRRACGTRAGCSLSGDTGIGLKSDPFRSSPLIIRPSLGWVPLNLGALWEYRELLYFLVWKDLKVRYKQTVLGIVWVLLQPSFITLAFSIFFGRLAGVPSDGIPYPLFAYCGLLPWQLFVHALTNSGNSLVANERLITKVYFPRLVIPLSAALSGLVDFVFGFAVLAGMMAYYKIVPTFAIWSMPGFVLMAVASAVGVGLWLSALNVQYRDVRYTLPFITQLWFFVSPVAYPSSLVPEKWRVLYGLNPMAGVVEGFRWAMLGKTEAPGPWMAVSAIATLVLLIGGLYYFRRTEKTFADLV
jgi:lipopolysaccharide transport system permease protein